MSSSSGVSQKDETNNVEAGSNGEHTPDHLSGPILPTWRLVALSISLCSGLFLSLLDTSIIATALYTIGLEFKSTNTVTWVALAYTLSYLGCAVTFARIGDIIGRRNTFTAAFVIFLASSIGCGFSQSLNQLIACRTLQGVGGSGLYSLTMVIFLEISPRKMLKWFAGLVGAVIAVAGVLGPVLGGIITHYTTWRWVFWINAPIGFVPVILFCIAWPSSTQMHHAERRPLRELDIIGSILLIAASVLVVFSLQEGGLNANAWGSALFIAPLVASCLCWILLFGWEMTVARFWEGTVAPIFPLRLLKRRVYMSGVLSATMIGFPYFVIIYSLPIRFQVVNEMSALSAGIGLLPMLGSTAIGSMLGGLISGGKDRTFETLLVATCFMCLGSGLLSTLSPIAVAEPKTYGFQVLTGLGFGLTVSTVSILASLECDIRDHSVAQGIVAQNRILGGSIGIAASTAILAATQQQQLITPGIVSASQLASLQASANTFTASQLDAVRQAYSDAFNDDMRVCAVIAGVCILVTLGTYRRNPPTMEEMKRNQIQEEEERLRNVTATIEEKV